MANLTYSPDGQFLFLQGQTIHWQGNLPPLILPEAGRFDLKLGRAVNTPALPERAWGGLVPSGDRRAIAWGSEGSIRVVPLFPVSGEPKVASFPVKMSHQGLFALASERGPVAWSDADSSVHVIEPGLSETPTCLKGHKQVVRGLLFTSDGKRLISAAGSDFDRPVEVIIWDVQGRRMHKRLPGLSGPFNKFFLSADNRTLAVDVRAVNESTDLIVWDVESGAKLHTSTYLAYGTPAAFSAVGRRLAVVEYSGAVRVLDLPRRR